jgi:hypothetical protein
LRHPVYIKYQISVSKIKVTLAGKGEMDIKIVSKPGHERCTLNSLHSEQGPVAAFRVRTWWFDEKRTVICRSKHVIRNAVPIITLSPWNHVATKKAIHMLSVRLRMGPVHAGSRETENFE